MSCCCRGQSCLSSVSCLGRCDLPKHRCLIREDVKPGPVPKYMGWHYTARDAPEHQLRCGWRPGHISCPVLRRIEQHNGSKSSEGCSISCPRPNCAAKPPNCSTCPSPPGPCRPIKCPTCPSGPPICRPAPSCPSASPCRPCGSEGKALIRITRHDGRYSITTEPSDVDNNPSGPYPLKYVLDTDDDELVKGKKIKFSVEAKYNDYLFDYTSSQGSFVLDFTPPDQRCCKPCPKSIVCLRCQADNTWPCPHTC